MLKLKAHSDFHDLFLKYCIKYTMPSDLEIIFFIGIISVLILSYNIVFQVNNILIIR